MSEEKLITYADLNALRGARGVFYDGTPRARLLDRLIAAAEADAPSLPEGWVLYTAHDGGRAVFWHRGGSVYQWDNTSDVYDYVSNDPDRFAPLRPTVTEADVKRAVDAAFYGGEVSDGQANRLVRAAFEAAGIEVQP